MDRYSQGSDANRGLDAWSRLAGKLRGWATDQLGAKMRARLEDKEEHRQLREWLDRTLRIQPADEDGPRWVTDQLRVARDTLQNLDRLPLGNLVYCSLFRFRPVLRTLRWERLDTKLFQPAFIASVVEGRESSLFIGEAAWAAGYFQYDPQLPGVAISDGLRDLRGSYLAADVILNQRTNILVPVWEKQPSSESSQSDAELLSVLNISMPVSGVMPEEDLLAELRWFVATDAEDILRLQREVENLKEVRDLALTSGRGEPGNNEPSSVVLRRLVADAFDCQSRPLVPMCGVLDMGLTGGGDIEEAIPERATWAVSPAFAAESTQGLLEASVYGLGRGAIEEKLHAIARSQNLVLEADYRIRPSAAAAAEPTNEVDLSPVLGALEGIWQIALIGPEDLSNFSSVSLEVKRSLLRDFLAAAFESTSGSVFEGSESRLHQVLLALDLEFPDTLSAALGTLRNWLTGRGRVETLMLKAEMSIPVLQLDSEVSYLEAFSVRAPGDQRWVSLSEAPSRVKFLPELGQLQRILSLLKAMTPLLTETPPSSCREWAVENFRLHAGADISQCLDAILPSIILKEKGTKIRVTRSETSDIEVMISNPILGDLQWRCNMIQQAVPIATVSRPRGSLKLDLGTDHRGGFDRSPDETMVDVRRSTDSWPWETWWYSGPSKGEDLVRQLWFLEQVTPRYRESINQFVLAPLPSGRVRDPARLTFKGWRATSSDKGSLLVLGLVAQDQEPIMNPSTSRGDLIVHCPSDDGSQRDLASRRFQGIIGAMKIVVGHNSAWVLRGKEGLLHNIFAHSKMNFSDLLADADRQGLPAKHQVYFKWLQTFVKVHRSMQGERFAWPTPTAIQLCSRFSRIRERAESAAKKKYIGAPPAVDLLSEEVSVSSLEGARDSSATWILDLLAENLLANALAAAYEASPPEREKRHVKISIQPMPDGCRALAIENSTNIQSWEKFERRRSLLHSGLGTILIDYLCGQMRIDLVVDNYKKRTHAGRQLLIPQK